MLDDSEQILEPFGKITSLLLPPNTNQYVIFVWLWCNDAICNLWLRPQMMFAQYDQKVSNDMKEKRKNNPISSATTRATQVQWL